MKSTVKLMILATALFLSSCGESIPDRLQEGTVLVKTEDGHGTAFFVRGKSGVCTLLTAAHVVRDKSVVRLQTHDGREREPLQIMPFDQDLDLAAVTFAPREGGRCPYRPLELGDSDGVEELAPIYVSGFPGRDGGEPVRQTISTIVTGLGNLPQGYSISYKGELYGGMSGGPVLDRWGKVVAVHGLSDRRLVELYDAQRQANLRPQELAAVRQAEERLRGRVPVDTFKWGIPINLYVRYRPAMVVPDGAGISSTFAWLLFGSGAVAGGLLVYFGVKPLASTAGAEGRRRQEEGWLDVKDIDNFPCEDLRIIDQLWVKYSDGRFGFSVQKDIYKKEGGTREYDEKIWKAFGDKVGWREQGNWLSYDKLNWALKAPVRTGHLPGPLTCWVGIRVPREGHWRGHLFSRAKTCNL